MAEKHRIQVANETTKQETKLEIEGFGEINVTAEDLLKQHKVELHQLGSEHNKIAKLLSRITGEAEDAVTRISHNKTNSTYELCQSIGDIENRNGYGTLVLWMARNYALRHDAAGYLYNPFELPIRFIDGGKLYHELVDKLRAVDCSIMAGLLRKDNSEHWSFRLTASPADRTTCTHVLIRASYGRVNPIYCASHDKVRQIFGERAWRVNDAYAYVAYIAVPIEDDLFLLDLLERTYAYVDEEEQKFRDKVALYLEAVRKYQEASKEAQWINYEIEQLMAECAENPICESPFVTPPKFEKRFEQEVIEFSLDDDAGTLRKKMAYINDLKEARYEVARFERIVENWKEFAPRYAESQEKVQEGLGGWLEIGEESATLFQPRSEGYSCIHNERLNSFKSRSWGFSYRALVNFLAYVDEAIDEEAGAGEKAAKWVEC